MYGRGTDTMIRSCQRHEPTSRSQRQPRRHRQASAPRRPSFFGPNRPRPASPANGRDTGRQPCLTRSWLGALALVAALCATTAPTRAWDDAKYPDLTGQWRAIGGPGRFDISKPGGRGQQAPLTPEYQAIFEANLVDQAAGGQGTTPTYKCISPGMPRVTNGYGEMEFIVTPDTTYILVDHIQDDRRIFTDGRSLAPRARADAAGLLDRPLGRYHRQRALRCPRGRDPRLPRPALLRRQRNSAAPGQRDRGQGTHLPRQGRSQRGP